LNCGHEFVFQQMLSSGTKRAAPSQSMWPLLCNEVGLSYDQEEKVRHVFQKQLLQDQNSWLHRHTAYAVGKVLASAHDAAQALTLRAGQRERTTMSLLSEEQRVKMLAWSTKNRDRVVASTASVPRTEQMASMFFHHDAANLYILNEKLQKVLETIPRAASLVNGKALKKLCRRPCFESLGAREESSNKGIDRDTSFASSGSLKRNASEMSMDGEDKPVVPQICPIEAQNAAIPHVQKTLGVVKDLLPTAPVDVAAPAAEAAPYVPYQSIPTPIPVTSLSYKAPASLVQSAPQFPSISGHERKSSFLPAHLNVVPEEMWPTGDDADDFLLDMIEGDWAIGEGIDMDLSP
jgi:hypothetical protein